MKKSRLLFALMLYSMINNVYALNIKEYITGLTNDSSNDSIYEINDTGLAYDGTIDNNLRYVGKNPNNYILFNGELYRIIGVMNNIEGVGGNSSGKVKIVKNESVGQYYFSDKIQMNYANSIIKDVLNSGDYFQTLDNESIELIADIIWKNGVVDSSWNFYTANELYNEERSDNTVNDQPVTFNGKIGLIYPTDYQYATNPSDYDREECLNNYSITGSSSDASSWSTNKKCYENDWLYYMLNQFSSSTMTIHATSGQGMGIFVTNNGNIRSFGPSIATFMKLDVYPSFYLNENVSIYDGDGSINNPYKIKLLKSFKIDIQSEHGVIETNIKDINNVLEQSNVKLDIRPDEGYELDSLMVLDNAGNELEIINNEFEMPESDVTINVLFKKVKEENKEETEIKIDTIAKEESIKENPKTEDNIIKYVLILGINIIILLFFIKNKVKYLFNK